MREKKNIRWLGIEGVEGFQILIKDVEKLL